MLSLAEGETLLEIKLLLEEVGEAVLVLELLRVGCAVFVAVVVFEDVIVELGVGVGKESLVRVVVFVEVLVSVPVRLPVPVDVPVRVEVIDLVDVAVAEEDRDSLDVADEVEEADPEREEDEDLVEVPEAEDDRVPLLDAVVDPVDVEDFVPPGERDSVGVEVGVLDSLEEADADFVAVTVFDDVVVLVEVLEDDDVLLDVLVDVDVRELVADLDSRGELVDVRELVEDRELDRLPIAVTEPLADRVEVLEGIAVTVGKRPESPRYLPLSTIVNS